MNRLISMADAATLFGFKGTPHACAKRARRRLTQVAEGDPSFALFKPAGSTLWHTTEADLRRILPQLFATPDDVIALEDVIAEQAAEIRKLRDRVARLENLRFAQKTQIGGHANAA